MCFKTSPLYAKPNNIHNYIKGYHDIITVVLLTFQPDPEARLSPETHELVEKMSLHRLRDSMGVGLVPLIGQLRYYPLVHRMVSNC